VGERRHEILCDDDHHDHHDHDDDTTDPLSRTISVCDQDLFTKYVVKILEYKMLNCKEPVPIADFNAVQSLCTLFDALATKDNGVNKEANPQGWLQASPVGMIIILILVFTIDHHYQPR
jgi:hypothetical protein